MKKSLIALVMAIVMVLGMVSAYAEVFQGTNEIVPETILVPKATINVTDGIVDAAYGEPVIYCIGESRAELEYVIHPRDSFLDDDVAVASTSKWYFAWDEEYFYITVDMNKPYVSEADAWANWAAGTDLFQCYIGLDDGDAEGTNDPHLGFGFNGNFDASELYVSCFEQSLPEAETDMSVLNELIIAGIKTSGMSTIYEVAIPIEEAIGIAAEEGEDLFYFSAAFFFDSGKAYEVGQGVFWADKTPTNSPLISFGPAVEVVAEEPAEEEPAAEEPAAEEPADLVEVEEPAEEPEVDAPAAETTTPAPSTTSPTTADVSVIFYALAALSAVGGVSIFKRK